MVLLDLRVVLFLLLVILVVTAALAIAIDRRLRRDLSPQITSTLAPSSETRVRPLLNDLAHELRTPLAVLLTHLEVQRSATVPAATKQESVRLMQAEARRMSQMVGNILELGELETKGLTAQRPLNLYALASDVVAEMTPFAETREIHLALKAETNGMWVNGDDARLKEVLINLVDNALKYSRANDRVEISLKRDSADSQIVCAVCDTGPGIASEHLPHIKRRFYRGTSEAVGGSGLGLALVDMILHLHDSTLEIESETKGEQTGTYMRFALPIAADMEHTL